MEAEVLQTVLTQVLEELKEIKQQQVDDKKCVVEISLRAGDLAEKLDGLKEQFGPVDLAPIFSPILDRLQKIEGKIEEEPKSITRRFRALLFREHGAREYYKIVFGRALLWTRFSPDSFDLSGLLFYGT